MTNGVFMYRSDSIYDDNPAEQYQFPGQYLTRAREFVGDWVVYLEPTKVPRSRGYFAIARVQKILPDPKAEGMFLALIEPGTFLDFAKSVSFNDNTGPVEAGLLNERGRLSGRAQAAVRPISLMDFGRILDLGMSDGDTLLPRRDEERLGQEWEEEAAIYDPGNPRPRIQSLTSRLARDRVFRVSVLKAYDEGCAFTGLKIINGGGRAEVQAAHIKPVADHGPDSVNNGLALSGTAHWMFDRGLLSLTDDLDIMISRHANDSDAIRAFLNRDLKARPPLPASNRPHPKYLQWHRDTCFKA